MNNNPYETPKSEVQSKNFQKRSIWWKIFFFIITLLSFTGMATFLVAEGVGIVDYVEFLLLIIATTGFFGFVFNKKILFPKFWFGFLIFYLISGFFYDSLSGVDMRDGMSDNMYYISLAVGYIISIPGYCALFLYSRESHQIWNN